MASDAANKTPKKARASKRSGSAPAVIDEATRARAETELRNHLAGREADLASAVLARVAGTTAASEKRNVEEWYAVASLALCDEAAIGARVEAMDRPARVALSLLSRAPWWSRTSLVQAMALASGDDPADDVTLSRALGEVLARWPVLVRTNAWTRAEELSLFEPLAVRARPLLKDALAVARVSGEPPPSADLRRTLLALALFPGLVAQRRPRVTRVGELHGADAAKLERTLGDARGLFTTWERLRAFEEVDGALSPIAARVRSLLAKPQAIAIEYVRAQLGDLGWSLASIAAQAAAGERVELGASLIAIGLARNFEYGFDVSTLTSFLERDAFRFAPLMLASAREDAIALPLDVRAAIRGEASGPVAGSSGGYVQPSYEVMLAPDAPLDAAFIIGCAAELTHFEAVARLTLTRQSVVAARALGIDTREIVGALESIAGSRGIPTAVRAAIDEWGDAIGEARVRTAIVFEVRGSDALLIKVAAELATIVLDRPAPHLFLLSRLPSPRELGQLRAIGVLTRAVSSTARAKADDDPAIELPNALGIELSDETHAPRDLRRVVEPRRVLQLVEASRTRARTGAATTIEATPSRAPTSIDPDEGTERELPEEVASALRERSTRWRDRGDWRRTLDGIVESSAFRRAASASAARLANAIVSASDPYVLQMTIARLDAEISMKRANDG
jgi:hypothetical protein